MTIDEAIDFAEDINATVTFPSESKLDEEFFDNIPDWLDELKDLREYKKRAEWVIKTHEQIRNEAIDEFVIEMRKYWGGMKAMEEIENIAKELKESK